MKIENLPHGTIILEPQRIFNAAIIKFDGVLFYSLAAMVESFQEKTDMTYLEIIENIYYNTFGYCPAGWPVLIDDLE